MNPKLTIEKLQEEAKLFCLIESKIKNSELYGITDGKAVGTYVEHKFQQQLKSKYSVTIGSSASGIDLPSKDILTDIKVTSIKTATVFLSIQRCQTEDFWFRIQSVGVRLQ